MLRKKQTEGKFFYHFLGENKTTKNANHVKFLICVTISLQRKRRQKICINQVVTKELPEGTGLHQNYWDGGSGRKGQASHQNSAAPVLIK